MVRFVGSVKNWPYLQRKDALFVKIGACVESEI